MENNVYQIEVKLCSEAIFNSGEKENNLVQEKALTDDHGFVYFHAKSFKGQLKRQGMWILKQYAKVDKDRAKEFYQHMDVLFGFNSEERKNFNNDMKGKYCFSIDESSKASTEGVIKLGHLQHHQEIRDFFINQRQQDEEKGYFRLNRYDLLEAQTFLRTGIQLKDGVVIDKKMTTYHTVKKGLTFYSQVRFDRKISDKCLEDFRLIVRSLRRIGAGIHRGRGLVEAKLTEVTSV